MEIHKPNIHILYNFKKGPWGGANQFLKTLKDQFVHLKLYEENSEKADAIIFNSYHQLLDALRIKINYPGKLFVHRLGPVFHLHRGKRWKLIDKLIIQVTNRIADLVIFQSNWSYREALKLGFKKNKAFSIIGNAVDERMFNKKEGTEFNPRKTKLVASSWSINWNKGFKFYQYLDEHLDFNKYEMFFIGNSPIKFKNIKLTGPMPSDDLAKELKKCDIFVSAVENDACSNSIIEALACGLPVVALNSGGNPDMIKNNGELFWTKEELIEKINLVKQNYFKYKVNATVANIAVIANKYLRAIKETRDEKDVTNLPKIGLKLFYYKTATFLFLFNIAEKIISLKPSLNFFFL